MLKMETGRARKKRAGGTSVGRAHTATDMSGSSGRARSTRKAEPRSARNPGSGTGWSTRSMPPDASIGPCRGTLALGKRRHFALVLAPLVVRSGCGRERDGERGAPVRPAVHGDAAAVRLDDGGGDGQPQAGTTAAPGSRRISPVEA